MVRPRYIVVLALFAAGSALAVPIDGNHATLEEKLAVINAESSSIDKDDPTVARFRFLTTSIEAASGLPREKVSDQLLDGRTLLLKEYGKKVSLLEFTEIAYRRRSLLSSIGLTEYIALLVVGLGTH